MKVGTDGVLLGAWAAGGKHILDIGTGTGVVALMMAQRFPDALIEGIDIDADACSEALENARSSSFAKRIKIKRCALQDISAEEWTGNHFDAIVSNPPFFLNSLKNPDTKRSLARHADSLPFSILCKTARRLLCPNGTLSVIVPAEALQSIVDEAYLAGFHTKERLAIKTVERKAPKRYMLKFSSDSSSAYKEETVILSNSDGSRSEWYQNLTKDFYIK